MPDLLIESADGVATLTMNRPEARNALSLEMRAGLDEAFHRFERDDAVRCGELERHRAKIEDRHGRIGLTHAVRDLKIVLDWITLIAHRLHGKAIDGAPEGFRKYLA